MKPGLYVPIELSRDQRKEIERLSVELAWSNKVCAYYGRLLSAGGIVPDHMEIT